MNLTALSDVSKDLYALNESFTSSDIIKMATVTMISDIEKIKDVIMKMTPDTLVSVLEEQREKWLDEKNVDVDHCCYAQLESDKSEIIKRRKLVVKKLDKAIESLTLKPHI